MARDGDMHGMRQGVQTAGALWAFIRPEAEALEKLDAYLREHHCKEGLAGRPKVMSEEAVQKLWDHMGSVDMTVFKQLPGEMVCVPCGWVHQVVNLRDCVKVACDVCQPDRLAAAIGAWEVLLSAAVQHSEDSVAAAPALVNAIVSLL